MSWVNEGYLIRHYLFLSNALGLIDYDSMGAIYDHLCRRPFTLAALQKMAERFR